MNMDDDGRGGRLAEVAGLYDRTATSYQRWWAPVIGPAALRVLDLVAALVADRPDAVMVDVGAGTGALARAAVARWPRVRAIAVDPSAGMLDVGRAEASRTLDPSQRQRLEWLTGVAEHLPIGDGEADVVASSFSLQYLGNRVGALREAHRVLRPGGEIAVVTWLANTGRFEPWRLLDSLLEELRLNRPPSGETDLFRSVPSAAALLRRAGFRDVHAMADVVEYQWAVGALISCALEFEERPLFDSLEPTTRDALERSWTERLARLAPADLLYRDPVVYATGRRIVGREPSAAPASRKAATFCHSTSGSSMS
jgi:ubiquinone/menaquinone biosynthesis C-methylase UbiE